jgi:multicomponent Na+:H+ antiporter subunit A
LRGAIRLTGMVQSGSLPAYLGTTLLTVLALPGVALGATAPRVLAALPAAVRDPLVEEVQLFETPVQLAVGLLLAVAAAGVAAARQRLAAVLLLGAVGYGVAVLFVMQGAPDLALTQFVIETVSLVAFVLALRHLPDRFPARRAGRGWRMGTVSQIAISAAVGLFVAAFAVVTASAQSQKTVAHEYLDRALPEAGGRNVVSTILVDFRAFDTFGEISVLTVAALGMVSMVILGRRIGGAMGGVRPRGTAAPDAIDAPDQAQRQTQSEERGQDQDQDQGGDEALNQNQRDKGRHQEQERRR